MVDVSFNAVDDDAVAALGGAVAANPVLRRVVAAECAGMEKRHEQQLGDAVDDNPRVVAWQKGEAPEAQARHDPCSRSATRQIEPGRWRGKRAEERDRVLSVQFHPDEKEKQKVERRAAAAASNLIPQGPRGLIPQHPDPDAPPDRPPPDACLTGVWHCYAANCAGHDDARYQIPGAASR
eukprot:gene8968-14722_t